MTSHSQKYPFCNFRLGSVCQNKFLKTFSRPIQVQTKVHFKILQFLVVTYDYVVLRCAIDVVITVAYGLYSLLRHFPETKMSKSPAIIVRECIFKNQNL